MKQIVKPRDPTGTRSRPGRKQVELAGQRSGIADGEDGAARIRASCGSPAWRRTSVGLREVFKSERRASRQRKRTRRADDDVDAGHVSSGAACASPGPRPSRREADDLSRGAARFLTVTGRPPVTPTSTTLKMARGEQDHDWIPRSACGRRPPPTRGQGGAAVETIGIGATPRQSLGEVRGIKNVERDRDAEAKAMAQNDPAVLAWLRAQR